MSTYLVLMLQEDKKLRWTQVFIRGAQSLGVGKEPNMSINPNSVRPGTVSEDRQPQNAMRVWESEMSIFYCRERSDSSIALFALSTLCRY